MNLFEIWLKSTNSGIDGGNPDSDLWICGLEHGLGTDDKNLIKKWYTDLAKEIKAGCKDSLPSWNKKKVDYFLEEDKKEKDSKGKLNWQRTFPYTFNRVVGRISIHYHQLGHKWNSKEERNFFQNELYQQQSLYSTFKLNLYPLPCATMDHWPNEAKELLEHHYEKEKAANKTFYQGLCESFRFQRIRDLITKHSPKVFIGVGESYKHNFATLFQFNEADFEKKKGIYFAKINKGETLLIVTPFFRVNNFRRPGFYNKQRIQDLLSIIEEEGFHFGSSPLKDAA